jgi:PAS domain S-box-containing protein
LTGTDIGRPFSHFSHRIGELNLLQLSREVLEKCEPVDREIVLENGNWYLVRLNPYLTHRNDCKGVVLTFVETTTTKLSIIRLEDALEKEQMSTEALHRSEERIAQLMKINANRIVYCRLLNEHKRPFTFISSNVREQLGYTTEEFTENPDFLFQQIHPDDLKGASDYFNNHDRAKALRKPFEFRFKKKDGSYCWLRDEPKLILDDDKKVLESLGMWTDITTEKMSN